MKALLKSLAFALVTNLCLSQNSLFAQVGERLTVSGKVTSGEDGDAIPGATVLEQGTSNGTVTNNEGNYQITVSGPNSILVFSFVGYVRQEVQVNGRTSIDLVLETDQQQLEEVVVVGYGTQRRKDLTGSIVRVTSDEFIQPSAGTFDQMLQGRVPGVQISQTSGAPGGNVNVLIRGVSSITGGNQPLYVVDGFPIGSGGAGDMRSYGASLFSSSGIAGNTDERINPLATLNPSDIESIEVLKDASATAIYGSRGANGVVIITTKRGSYGKPEINVDASYGIQEVANKLDMMNAREYAEFVAEGRDNTWEFAGGSRNDPNAVRSSATRVPPEFRDPASLTVDTDWQDVIFRVAPVRDLQLSTRGGNESTRYYLAAGYFSQEGIVKTSDYNRFNLRLNLDASLSERIKVGTSTYGSYGFGRFANTEGHYGTGGVIMAALTAAPTIPVYDDQGNPYFNNDDVTYALGWLANPLVLLDEFQDRRKVLNVFSNTFLEYDITDNLVFKTSIGVNFESNNIRLWRSSAIPRFTTLNYPANAGSTKTETVNWLNENTLSYNKLFNDKHLVNGLLGFTSQKNSADRVSVGASDFPTDYVTFLSAGIVNAGTHVLSEWSLLSMMARVNYSYDGKFLFTGTVRRDGSSRFGRNNKWGTFPSISFGYNISEEPFLKNSDLVSNLKLRLSYGISGNNQIGNYTHIGLLGNTRYIENNSLKPGLVPTSLPNDNLTWEKSKQTNIGIDLGLFADRISLTADIYRDLKTDLLLAVQLPALSGFDNSTQNIGDIENRGLEIGLNTLNITGENFKWRSNLTFSANRNKVLRLASGDGRIFSSSVQITEVGLPVSSFYLLHATGVFQNEEEIANSALYHPRTQPGDLKFEDVDGNGVINQSDRKVLGNPWPDFTWGFNNLFTVGNFDLDIAVVGSQGAHAHFDAGGLLYNSASVQNQLAAINDRWRSESDPGNGKISRAIRNNYANGSGSSSRYLFDASFVRIRNIKLSYKLPQTVSSKTGLNSAVVYANISNLHTFTDYPGYDPESSTAGGNIVAAGLDNLTYPLSRTYTLGLRISL